MHSNTPLSWARREPSRIPTCPRLVHTTTRNSRLVVLRNREQGESHASDGPFPGRHGSISRDKPAERAPNPTVRGYELVTLHSKLSVQLSFAAFLMYILASTASNTYNISTVDLVQINFMACMLAMTSRKSISMHQSFVLVDSFFLNYT
jgi:hypothetical protein